MHILFVEMDSQFLSLGISMCLCSISRVPYRSQVYAGLVATIESGCECDRELGLSGNLPV